MPSSGTVAAGTLVVLVATAGVGAHAFDATGDLEEALDTAVADAMRDLTVGWLDVQGSHGPVDNGTVPNATLLVRPSSTAGPLDLERVVVEQDNRTTVPLEVDEVLRDEDDSLADGVLNEGDLVRVVVAFDEPLEADASTTLTMHHPSGAPLTVELTAPRNLGGSLVELDHRVTW